MGSRIEPCKSPRQNFDPQQSAIEIRAILPADVSARQVCGRFCNPLIDQSKIAIDGFVDHAISALVLAFSAKAIGRPCNNKGVFRIAKTH
jgi:hypothetical protein